MNTGKINFSRTDAYIARNPPSASRDFCRATYYATFTLDDLSKEGRFADWKSLLRPPQRPRIAELNERIVNGKSRLAAFVRRGEANNALAQRQIINHNIDQFNNILEQKRAELLTFKTECDAHLSVEQKAVIEEERKRLEDQKLQPLPIIARHMPVSRPALNKPKSENHFPTLIPVLPVNALEGLEEILWFLLPKAH